MTVQLKVGFVQKGDVDAGDFPGEPDLFLSELFVIEGGMSSGKPSIAVRITLPDGRELVAQTSAKALVAATKIIEGRYPELLDD
jgi:hypothetical protein